MEHRRIPLPRPDRLAVLPPDMIGQAIDRLIEALDQRQGDIDLEDSEAGQTDIDERGHRLGDHRLGFLEGLGPTDDPERELNGDESDSGNAEDEIVTGEIAIYGMDRLPGCSIADAGEYAAPEWHTRGRHKNPDWKGRLPHEDAEDDDPLEANGDERDVSYRNDTRGNLDPGGEEDDEWDAGEAPAIVSAIVGPGEIEDDEEDDHAGTDGDELDGSASEDEFMSHGHGWAAGCPVADPDCCNAKEDQGTAVGSYDGQPGDPEDAEDGGDTELNGDEGDHSGEPNV